MGRFTRGRNFNLGQASHLPASVLYREKVLSEFSSIRILLSPAQFWYIKCTMYEIPKAWRFLDVFPKVNENSSLNFLLENMGWGSSLPATFLFLFWNNIFPGLTSTFLQYLHRGYKINNNKKNSTKNISKVTKMDLKERVYGLFKRRLPFFLSVEVPCWFSINNRLGIATDSTMHTGAQITHKFCRLLLPSAWKQTRQWWIRATSYGTDILQHTGRNDYT